MPYRAELKRPDLKGSFPCSVCGKIFCHSSSLSRHRMQAHFKSYTCTQCNTEISSNDTLRSHMFRYHNITRMFMCRCCNWAFPDKTSLHIHMQSMLRNGTPGDVAVLARSSTEDGHMDSPASPSGSLTPEHLLKSQLLKTASLKNHNNNNMSSIFPNLLKSMESQPSPNKIFPLDLSSMASNQFLAAWLANNHMSSNESSKKNEQPKQENSSDYDELEVHTTEEDFKDDEEDDDGETNSSVIMKNEAKKRKLQYSSHENDDIDVEGDSGEPQLKMSIDDHISHEQPSPTVSDSHISGSSSHTSEVVKCFDCQVAKGKLSASEEKCRAYEKQIKEMQVQLETLRKLAIPQEPVRTSILPPMMMQPAPTPVVPMPNVANNNILQNPAIRMLFSNFMQNQMNRQMC